MNVLDYYAMVNRRLTAKDKEAFLEQERKLQLENQQEEMRYLEETYNAERME